MEEQVEGVVSQIRSRSFLPSFPRVLHDFANDIPLGPQFPSCKKRSCFMEAEKMAVI